MNHTTFKIFENNMSVEAIGFFFLILKGFTTKNELKKMACVSNDKYYRIINELVQNEFIKNENGNIIVTKI